MRQSSLKLSTELAYCISELESGSQLFVNIVDSLAKKNRLCALFINSDVLKTFFDSKLIDDDDIEYLYESIFSVSDFLQVLNNTWLVKRLLEHVGLRSLELIERLHKLIDDTGDDDLDDLDFDSFLSALNADRRFDLRTYEFLAFHSVLKDNFDISCYRYEPDVLKVVRFLVECIQGKRIRLLDAIKLFKKHGKFDVLITNTDFFSLISQSKISVKSSLVHLKQELTSSYALEVLSTNESALQLFVDHAVCSVHELIDAYSRKRRLKCLVQNESFFKHLVDSQKLDATSVCRLYELLQSDDEIRALSKNAYVLSSFIQQSLMTFDEVVDNYKKRELFSEILRNGKFFELCLKNSKLTDYQLLTLLKSVSNDEQAYAVLVSNEFCLRRLAQGFHLDSAFFEKYENLLKHPRSCEPLLKVSEYADMRKMNRFSDYIAFFATRCFDEVLKWGFSHKLRRMFEYEERGITDIKEQDELEHVESESAQDFVELVTWNQLLSTFEWMSAADKRQMLESHKFDESVKHKLSVAIEHNLEKTFSSIRDLEIWMGLEFTSKL